MERNRATCYVLVVSSMAAFTSAPGGAAYHASKAGAEYFANTLRLEVAHLGVDVGSAHMSMIDTPLNHEINLHQDVEINQTIHPLTYD